jgi:hypothetical protein
MRWLRVRRRRRLERSDELLRAAIDRDLVVNSVAAELSNHYQRNHYAERLSIIMRGHA